MSASDVPLRIEVQKLRRQLMAAIATLGQSVAILSGGDKFRLLASWTDAATVSLSGVKMLIVQADYDDNAAIFVQGGTGTVDGVNTLADADGTKFTRFRPDANLPI